MNDAPKKLTFGSLQLPAIDARLRPGTAPAARLGPLDEVIQFSTFLTRGTYLRLLQRVHWEPGFQMKDAVDAALTAFLDAGPDQPLPPARLAKLLQTNKKLRAA